MLQYNLISLYWMVQPTWCQQNCLRDYSEYCGVQWQYSQRHWWSDTSLQRTWQAHRCWRCWLCDIVAVLVPIVQRPKITRNSTQLIRICGQIVTRPKSSVVTLLLVRYTNRPFRHESRCTIRLITTDDCAKLSGETAQRVTETISACRH